MVTPNISPVEVCLIFYQKITFFLALTSVLRMEILPQRTDNAPKTLQSSFAYETSPCNLYFTDGRLVGLLLLSFAMLLWFTEFPS